MAFMDIDSYIEYKKHRGKGKHVGHQPDRADPALSRTRVMEIASPPALRLAATEAADAKPPAIKEETASSPTQRANPRRKEYARWMTWVAVCCILVFFVLARVAPPAEPSLSAKYTFDARADAMSQIVGILNRSESLVTQSSNPIVAEAEEIRTQLCQAAGTATTVSRLTRKLGASMDTLMAHQHRPSKHEQSVHAFNQTNQLLLSIESQLVKTLNHVAAAGGLFDDAVHKCNTKKDRLVTAVKSHLIFSPMAWTNPFDQKVKLESDQIDDALKVYKQGQVQCRGSVAPLEAERRLWVDVQSALGDVAERMSNGSLSHAQASEDTISVICDACGC